MAGLTDLESSGAGERGDRLALLHGLATAALNAGLMECGRRTLLLEGLGDRVRSQLREHPRPLDQVFSDVCTLARLGGPQLDVWLRNCAFLAGEMQGRFFTHARLHIPAMITSGSGPCEQPDEPARR